VARKLASELSNKDINILGIQNDGWSEIETTGIKIISGVEEVDSKVNYVFDFGLRDESLEIAEKWGARLTMVRINQAGEEIDFKKRFENREVNWRVIEAWGVYGIGMDQYVGDETTECLKENMVNAVLNRNLQLPPKETEIRLLLVDEAVEAIMRASFLSGTEMERYQIWGKAMRVEELAKSMIDKAKMTRFKVVEREWRSKAVDPLMVEQFWKKLRWEPKIEFNEGVEETLRNFFGRIEEERRRERKITTSLPSFNKEVEGLAKNKGRFEVVVDGQELYQPEEGGVSSPSAVDQDLEDEVVRESEDLIEEVVVEMAEEEKPEIEEVVEIKNSNKREVAGEEVVDKVLEEEADESMAEVIKAYEPKKQIETLIVKKVLTSKQRFKLRPVGGWWWKTMLMMVMLVVILIIGELGKLGWTGYQVARDIKKGEELIRAGKYDQVAPQVDKALVKVNRAEGEINYWGLNELETGRRYQSLLRVGGDGLRLEKGMAELIKLSDKVNRGIMDGNKIDWDKLVEDLQVATLEVGRQSGGLLARLQGDWSWIPSRYKPALEERKRELEKGVATLGLAGEVVRLLPEIIGVGTVKKYMVLFQNESELRPGGGFIGSYGMLTFRNGAVDDFQIKDIYEADGQLKGHVEPPEEIKQYLGEAGWFMRDANWQANLPAAVKDIQWFLDKETGEKVDGVVGMDMEVAKTLLGVVGEVNVPDFKEKINIDNLFETAEYYAEKKFFPGSSQKANFLGALGKQLFEEIKILKGEKQWLLVAGMIDLLERNELWMVMNDKKVAEAIASLGWDGAIYEGKCAMERCLADYLYIVEANLGVNKANYFIRRNIEQTAEITESQINRVVKINYENTAKNDKWPGGMYKNYLRVYLPKESMVNEVSIQQGEKVVTLGGGEVKIKETGSKKEVGWLVEVGVDSRVTVTLKYSNQINLSAIKDKFSYLLYVQKQPGFGDTGLVTLVSYPASWQPLQAQPSASVVGGKLLFNLKLDRDLKLGVELSK